MIKGPDMDRIRALRDELQGITANLNRAAGARDNLEETIRGLESELAKAKADLVIWQQVQVLLTKTADFAREQLTARVEELVTAALQSVFMDDGMRFKIELKTVAGKPAAYWLVESCYGERTVSASPEDARGGGVTDVVSLALRLALLELARPKPGGPILLDEPGKHVSKEYITNLGAFLRRYAQETGRQMIMVTHHEPLIEVADVAWRVNQRQDGISEVTKA